MGVIADIELHPVIVHANLATINKLFGKMKLPDSDSALNIFHYTYDENMTPVLSFDMSYIAHAKSLDTFETWLSNCPKALLDECITFTKGDMVSHKTSVNGLTMIVDHIDHKSNKYVCEWFDVYNQLHFSSFPASSLKPVLDPKEISIDRLLGNIDLSSKLLELEIFTVADLLNTQRTILGTFSNITFVERKLAVLGLKLQS